METSLELTGTQQHQLHARAVADATSIILDDSGEPLTARVVITRFGKYCAANCRGAEGAMRRSAAADVVEEFLYPGALAEAAADNYDLTERLAYVNAVRAAFGYVPFAPFASYEELYRHELLVMKHTEDGQDPWG